jgi:hypothetical protein
MTFSALAAAQQRVAMVRCQLAEIACRSVTFLGTAHIARHGRSAVDMHVRRSRDMPCNGFFSMHRHSIPAGTRAKTGSVLRAATGQPKHVSAAATRPGRYTALTQLWTTAYIQMCSELVS